MMKKKWFLTGFFWMMGLVHGMGALRAAEGEEYLHKQHPQAGDLQVQTLGGDVDPKLSFWQRYAPPENISTTGAHFDDVFAYVSWGGLICFLIVCFATAYFAWAYRERPGRKAFYTVGLAEKKYTMVIDIIFFLAMDCYLIYFSVLDTKRYMMTVPTGPDTVKIEVMPQQWVWNFRYPGMDGEFNTADDIVTVNEMRIPKGRQVYLQIKSKDVIHGFMVPNIRRQIDAIPGNVTRIWFDATKTGDYEIACMHLCGTSHYKMKGFMKVVENSDYEAWSKEMSDWSAATFDPDDKRTHWGWPWGVL
jgi:cytochrome c oxidase subunit 2